MVYTCFMVDTFHSLFIDKLFHLFCDVVTRDVLIQLFSPVLLRSKYLLMIDMIIIYIVHTDDIGEQFTISG